MSGLTIGKTHRGFDLIEFKDYNGESCSLQKSSIATRDVIWLGTEDAKPRLFTPNEGWADVPVPPNTSFTTRMHLTVEQVEALLPFLQRFVATGEIT